MNLSEFQNKDVINIKDGRRIGNIIDCKIDSTTGEIKSLDNWKKFLPSHENYENFCQAKLRPVQLKDPYTWECSKADSQEQMDRINSFLVQYNNAAKDL